jgi:hypothetical protein
MAPHGRGRALHGTKAARPQYDRLGRRKNNKIAADGESPQAARERASAVGRLHLTGLQRLRWAADDRSIAERPR